MSVVLISWKDPGLVNSQISNPMTAFRSPSRRSVDSWKDQSGLDRGGEDTKGSRVIYDILEPITSLQGLKFWKAYWEVIECHYVLWREGIRLGDISVSNLMHRNGTGVLNDFDLVELTLPGDEHSRDIDWRISTTVFLALDMLTQRAQAGKVERRYRHDLESFFWILLWIAACYEDGVRKVPASHRSWLLQNTVTRTCRLRKYDTMLKQSITTNSYQSLAAGVLVLQLHWMTYFNQRMERALDLRSQQIMAQRAKTPSSSASLGPIVFPELPDEQVLFNMFDAFTSMTFIADFVRSEDLIPDLPLALFPTYINASDTST